MRKPVKGETLYSLNVGNAARHREQKLTPVTVTKVGRKYFTCAKEGWNHGTIYHIDTWYEKTECSASSCLYESVDEYNNGIEKNKLYDEVKGYFSGYGRNNKISLEQLRKIIEIVRQYDEKEDE